MTLMKSILNLVDPKYEEEVSGCTASVGLISNTKIYVVRACLNFVTAVDC